MISLFQQSPTLALIVLGLIILSLALHELGHAYAAEISGDPTPKLEGRLSFNPLVHIDPFGLALIVLVGFGFARPVMTRPANFKYAWSELLVSSAGILVNLTIAIICAFFIPRVSGALETVLNVTLLLNCGLVILNALPIPPLDGSHILAALLPKNLGNTLRTWSYSSSWMGLVAIVLLQGPIGQLARGLRDILLGWFS